MEPGWWSTLGTSTKISAPQYPFCKMGLVISFHAIKLLLAFPIIITYRPVPAIWVSWWKGGTECSNPRPIFWKQMQKSHQSPNHPSQKSFPSEKRPGEALQKAMLPPHSSTAAEYKAEAGTTSFPPRTQCFCGAMRRASYCVIHAGWKGPRRPAVWRWLRSDSAQHVLFPWLLCVLPLED